MLVHSRNGQETNLKIKNVTPNKSETARREHLPLRPRETSELLLSRRPWRCLDFLDDWKGKNLVPPFLSSYRCVFLNIDGGTDNISI